MKPKTLFIQYKEFMSDIQTPLDFLLAAWIHMLAAVAITGVGRIIYEAIANPTIFRGILGSID